MKPTLALLAVLLFLSAAADDKPARDPREFDRSNMNANVKACDDFYEYVNGGWLARNPIPPEYTGWGVGTLVTEDNRKVLHEILEAAAAKPAAQRTPNEQKIGDFWTSCMNEQAVNAAGLAPLQPELARIAAVGSVADLQAEIARLQVNNSL